MIVYIYININCQKSMDMSIINKFNVNAKKVKKIDE